MAIDWVKRFTKHGSAWLAPDEQFVGGIAVQPAGSLTRTAIGGGVGGAIGAGIAASMSGKADEKLAGDVGGIAPADFSVPGNGLAVAVTSARLLFCTQGLSGKPKEVLRAFPIGEVLVQVLDRTAIKVVKTRAFVFRFADGTALTAEAPTMGPGGKLADAFEAALAQAGARVEHVTV